MLDRWRYATIACVLAVSACAAAGPSASPTGTGAGSPPATSTTTPTPGPTATPTETPVESAEPTPGPTSTPTTVSPDAPYLVRLATFSDIGCCGAIIEYLADGTILTEDEKGIAVSKLSALGLARLRSYLAENADLLVRNPPVVLTSHVDEMGTPGGHGVAGYALTFPDGKGGDVHGGGGYLGDSGFYDPNFAAFRMATFLEALHSNFLARDTSGENFAIPPVADPATTAVTRYSAQKRVVFVRTSLSTYANATDPVPSATLLTIGTAIPGSADVANEWGPIRCAVLDPAGYPQLGLGAELSLRRVFDATFLDPTGHDLAVVVVNPLPDELGRGCSGWFSPESGSTFNAP